MKADQNPLGKYAQSVLVTLFSEGQAMTLDELDNSLDFGRGVIDHSLTDLKERGLVSEDKSFGPEGTLPAYRPTDEGKAIAYEFVNKG